MKIEPDPPFNIGSGKDPIDQEFEEWFKAIPANIWEDSFSKLEEQLMKEAWNAAWHKYSPEESEDPILNHIKTLLLLHPNMKMDRGTSMKILAMFNRELGI